MSDSTLWKLAYPLSPVQFGILALMEILISAQNLEDKCGRRQVMIFEAKTKLFFFFFFGMPIHFQICSRLASPSFRLGWITLSSHLPQNLENTPGWVFIECYGGVWNMLWVTSELIWQYDARVDGEWVSKLGSGGWDFHILQSPLPSLTVMVIFCLNASHCSLEASIILLIFTFSAVVHHFVSF